GGAAAKPSRKVRLNCEQLEYRLVPSDSASIAIVNPPATFVEGTAINLSSNVVNPVGTPTYAWTVLKDGASFTTGTTANFSFTPDDNGTYAVSLDVTDSANTVSDSTTITVVNQAPVAGVSGPT